VIVATAVLCVLLNKASSNFKARESEDSLSLTCYQWTTQRQYRIVTTCRPSLGVRWNARAAGEKSVACTVASGKSRCAD